MTPRALTERCGGMEPSSCSLRRAATTWSPSATTRGSAAPFATWRSGPARIHADACIVLVETVSIEGRVLDNRGVAVDRRISIRPAAQPASDDVATGFSSVPDGAFEVAGLLPGRYVVTALPPREGATPRARRDAPTSAASATVTAPVQGLTLVAPRSLTGWSSWAPRPKVAVPGGACAYTSATTSDGRGSSRTPARAWPWSTR